MQLYADNFIPLLGSLYMFRVFYTPIIRSTFHQNGNLIQEQHCNKQNPLYQLAIDPTLCNSPPTTQSIHRT